MPLQLNFLQDWYAQLRNELSIRNYQVSPIETDDSVSIRYFNMVSRLIPLRPRNVLLPEGFICPPGLEAGLQIVLDQITIGSDLRSHTSRRIMDVDFSDPLLNDWGIFHLHLGTVVESDGFIARTGPVLFVRFDNSNAYLITIQDHGAWSDQAMLSVLHNNWPESIQAFHAPDILGLQHNLSNDEISKLRKAGGTSMIEVAPNFVYMPLGGGVTSGGLSAGKGKVGIRVRRNANAWQKRISILEDDFRAKYRQYLITVNRLDLAHLTDISYKLKATEEGLFIFNRDHNVIFGPFDLYK
jgi:hypothetical protein